MNFSAPFAMPLHSLHPPDPPLVGFLAVGLGLISCYSAAWYAAMYSSRIRLHQRLQRQQLIRDVRSLIKDDYSDNYNQDSDDDSLSYSSYGEKRIHSDYSWRILDIEPMTKGGPWWRRRQTGGEIPLHYVSAIQLAFVLLELKQQSQRLDELEVILRQLDMGCEYN